MSDMEVVLTNNSKIDDIDKVEEAENGIFIHRRTESTMKKVGYVPYGSLSHVRPRDG